MQRVARDNDPQAVVDPLPIGDDFIGFTRAYATRDDRRRMGTLVDDSREAFLRSRNWNFGIVLLCHGIELRKRGSTELIDLVDGWKSMDTLSAHHHACAAGAAGAASGRSATAPPLPKPNSPTCPATAVRADTNLRARRIVRRHRQGLRPLGHHDRRRAIPTFRTGSTVRQRCTSQPRAARSASPAVAQRSGGSSSWPLPLGGCSSSTAPRTRVSAPSRAWRCSSKRPDAGNTVHGHTELARSLFNPYWQRLGPANASRRAQAQLPGRAVPASRHLQHPAGSLYPGPVPAHRRRSGFACCQGRRRARGSPLAAVCPRAGARPTHHESPVGRGAAAAGS